MIVGTVSMREKTETDDDQQNELEVYNKTQRWLRECKEDFVEWYERAQKLEKDEKRVRILTEP